MASFFLLFGLLGNLLRFWGHYWCAVNAFNLVHFRFLLLRTCIILDQINWEIWFTLRRVQRIWGSFCLVSSDEKFGWFCLISTLFDPKRRYFEACNVSIIIRDEGRAGSWNWRQESSRSLWGDRAGGRRFCQLSQATCRSNLTHQAKLWRLGDVVEEFARLRKLLIMLSLE